MKWLIGIIVLLLVITGGWYVLSNSSASVSQPSTQATTTTSTPVVSGAQNLTYTNSRLAFSIQYPATASTTTAFSAGYLPLTATPVIGIELPKSMFSGTNLVDAGVYIGATTTPSVMTSCTDLSQVKGAVSTSSVTIGGQNLIEVDSKQGAAGNLYQQKTFRAFQNGSCIEIVELLHSGNIGNYTPGTVQPFDQAKFQRLLDTIVQTYLPLPTGQ